MTLPALVARLGMGGEATKASPEMMNEPLRFAQIEINGIATS